MRRERLIHFKGKVMDVYRPLSLPRMVNVVNRWTITRIGQELEQCGQVCTIREVEVVVVAVVSNTDPPREEIMPTKIKEVLKEWGCTWMWKSLRLVGSDEWIKEATEGRALLNKNLTLHFFGSRNK